MKRLVDELAEAIDIPTPAHSAMWRALLQRAAEAPVLVADLAQRIRAAHD